MSNFDKHACGYEEKLNNSLKIIGSDGDYFAEYKVKEILELLQINGFPNSDLKILNYGCGIGKSELFLSRYFPDSLIFGIDISIESLLIAKKAGPNNCHFVHYDGVNVPFKENLFNIIIIANVFHHISFEHHQNILSTLRRHLRHKGVLFLFEHNPLNPLTRYIVDRCEFDSDAKLLSTRYARSIVKRAGYNNLQLNYIYFLPPFLNKFHFIEKYLYRLPIGGGYYIAAW